MQWICVFSMPNVASSMFLAWPRLFSYLFYCSNNALSSVVAENIALSKMFKALSTVNYFLWACYQFVDAEMAVTAKHMSFCFKSTGYHRFLPENLCFGLTLTQVAIYHLCHRFSVQKYLGLKTVLLKDGKTKPVEWLWKQENVCQPVSNMYWECFHLLLYLKMCDLVCYTYGSLCGYRHRLIQVFVTGWGGYVSFSQTFHWILNSYCTM